VKYLVKIIPPKGYTIHRIEFARWHVAAALAGLLVIVAVLAGSYTLRMHWAADNVRRLQAASVEQADELGKIDRRAQALGAELQRIQHQNQQIRRLVGVDRGAQKPQAAPRAEQHAATNALHPADVAARLSRLETASRRLSSDEARLRSLALRVLNVRRIQELAQAQLVASIPSINPVPGTPIASAFGWRSDPWPSFHQGVDLDANYGDTVLASAAGTVVSATWDGGYGLKVDIDHGNGYHTWYAHLSRVDVQPGEYVHKTQAIALVGATGDATGPHLHYAVIHEGQPIDPTPFLTGVPPQVLASLR
jgi:murein DD-endopeptidase MepM/ murein hydrolase activator NlpD